MSPLLTRPGPALRDIVVSDAAVFASVLRYLVVGGVFGVAGDYVPGVQEAGDEAEAAEGEVYEGVGGADAAFDPDCNRGGRGGC